MSKLYALLVGINDYPAPMAKLEGCHNCIDKVEFVFAEQIAGGGEHVHTGPDLTVELRKIGETWPDVLGHLRLGNRRLPLSEPKIR